MTEHDIKVLAIQEAHISKNTRESRKQYTWFFSGEGSTAQYQCNYLPTGVGFVIANTFLKYTQDIHPVSDRICKLTLAYTVPTTLISAYAPQAGRPEQERDDFYEELQRQYNSSKGKGPTYILGDMNARVQATHGDEEVQIVGPNTFDANNADPLGRSEQVIENRQALIDFCSTNDMRLANTFHEKPDSKLATYREKETLLGEEFRRGKYEQIDFILVPKRWNNTVLNTESDTLANVTSDHYPVRASIRIKLKAAPSKSPVRRQRYDKCSTEQQKALNEALAAKPGNTYKQTTARRIAHTSSNQTP